MGMKFRLRTLCDAERRLGETLAARKSKKKGGKAKSKENDSQFSWAKALLFTALTLLILAGSTVLGLYLYFAHGLPSFETLADYRPAQLSRVLDRNGDLIAEFYEERRTLVGRDQLPDVLIQAVLSAEDAAFYEHEGLDYFGMLRALYKGVKAGRVRGGGSTITQQTVKNLLLTSEKTMRRKIREVILARRLESHLSKDDILTIYLNAIYLGHGRYGVQEACRYYFGRDVSQINLNQAATLAGLIQAPNGISPRRNLKRAEARREYVLRQMVKNGFISSEQADRTLKDSIELGRIPPDRPAHLGWFVDEVRGQLSKSIGQDLLFRGGLTIHTTLDSSRQAAAYAAARRGLRELDKRRKTVKTRGHVSRSGIQKWRAKRRRVLKGKPPGLGATVLGRISKVGKSAIVFDLGIGEGTLPRRSIERLIPRSKDKSGSLKLKVGDILTVHVRADGPKHPSRMKLALAGLPQAAFVILSNRDRSVLAMVGGWDYRDSSFNRVIQAKRQPGSAFKTMVWGAAMESGRFTPATMMIDAPETLRIYQGSYWRPKNYTGQHRGSLSLRGALAHSVNSVAVDLAGQVGIDKVHDFARRTGIKSDLIKSPSLALGASEVSPLEMVNAYTTIASGGRTGGPIFVTKVVGQDGVLLSSERTPGADGLTPEVAFLLRTQLRSVVTEGSARRLKDLKQEVIGKTGTTNQARDTWFVGAIPDVTFGVWVGYDDNRPLGGKESGSRTAVPIVKSYLENSDQHGPTWPEPPEGISTRLVTEDGKLVSEADPTSRTEFFLQGTEPTEYALKADELDGSNFFFESDEEGEVQLEEAKSALAPAAPSKAQLAPDLRPVEPTRALSDTPLAPLAPQPSSSAKALNEAPRPRQAADTLGTRPVSPPDLEDLPE